MQITLDVAKGTGEVLGNVLRQLCMSKLGCWAPVAFSLNREFNLMSAAPSIVEDPIRIMANLSKYRYSPKFSGRNDEMLSETFTFVGALKPGNMESNFFNIHGNDTPLITSLDDSPVELKVLYRYGAGAFSSPDNAQFLEDRGEQSKLYQVMASRHTNVKSFTFDVSGVTSTSEKLTLKLISDIGNEKELLHDTFETLETLVGSAFRDFVGKSSTIPEEVL